MAMYRGMAARGHCIASVARGQPRTTLCPTSRIPGRGTSSSRRSRAKIAICLPDALERTRVCSALATDYQTVHAEEGEDLLRLLSGASPVGAVLDLNNGSEDSATLIADVRRRYPALALVGVTNLLAAEARRLLVFARLGLDRVVFRGVDELAAVLRHELAAAIGDRAPLEVLGSLDVPTTAHAGSLLRTCLTHGTQPLSVSALARELGISRRTLLNWSSAAALPPPSALVSWCRLLHASRLVEMEGRTIESAALALGFGSGSALRNAFRRHLGLRPSEIRARGGYAYVIRQFSAFLHKPRSHSRLKVPVEVPGGT